MVTSNYVIITGSPRSCDTSCFTVQLADNSPPYSADKHHLIYITFTGCFLHIILYNMTHNWWVTSSISVVISPIYSTSSKRVHMQISMCAPSNSATAWRTWAARARSSLLAALILLASYLSVLGIHGLVMKKHVFCSSIRYLQPYDSVSVLPAVLPVSLLDVWRFCTQWSLCPLSALWGSFWTPGFQHPQSVRTMFSSCSNDQGLTFPSPSGYEISWTPIQVRIAFNTAKQNSKLTTYLGSVGECHRIWKQMFRVKSSVECFFNSTTPLSKNLWPCVQHDETNCDNFQSYI